MFRQTCRYILFFLLVFLAIVVGISMQQAKLPKRDPLVLMNKYYALKDKQPYQAELFLSVILTKYPDYQSVLHVLPPINMEQHEPEKLSNFWQPTYHLTCLLWFFLNQLKSPWQWNSVAIDMPVMTTPLPVMNPIKKINKKIDQPTPHPSENNQKNIFKSPYYAELFFTPFSQSRFALSVNQILLRYGAEQANRWETKEYFFMRSTADNRSKNLGQLTELYEDNAQIEGVGGQMKPFKRLPMIVFLETGAAYDLVYQNRPRWRPDLRTGLMFYQDVGAQPAFFQKPTFNFCYYANWYAELTYFTRYGNLIGGLRTNQGVRLAQYKSSMINFYLTGRVIFDSQRLFYNNFVEYGPGLALVPNNRYNFALRLEHVRGAYLPAGATPNPYGPRYHNNLIQLLLYIKL